MLNTFNGVIEKKNVCVSADVSISECFFFAAWFWHQTQKVQISLHFKENSNIIGCYITFSLSNHQFNERILTKLSNITTETRVNPPSGWIITIVSRVHEHLVVPSRSSGSRVHWSAPGRQTWCSLSVRKNERRVN